ncbi:MAG: K+/H+ antiporter subunit F [Desulfosoma sp.]
MILSMAFLVALFMMCTALVLCLWRLVLGPDMPDRVLALDTLYINTIALLVLLGVYYPSQVYFESAVVLAMCGFISTTAFLKYLLRGDIIE